MAKLKKPGTNQLVEVADHQVEFLKQKGFQELTEEDLNRILEKEEYSDIGSQTAAALAGAAQAVSLGISNALMVGVPRLLGQRETAKDVQEYLRKLQEFSPEASIGGEVVGTVGSLFIPGGQLGAVAKATTYTGKAARLALAAGRGASTPLRGALGAGRFAQRAVAGKFAKNLLGERLTGKVGQSIVREATEGAIYGAGVAFSETMLGKQDLISQETLMHVGLGGVFGASLPAVFHGGKALLTPAYRKAAVATQATADFVQDFTKDIVMDKAVGSVAALAAGPIGASIGGTVGKAGAAILESPLVEEAIGKAGKELLGRTGQAAGRTVAKTTGAIAGGLGYVGGAAAGGLGGIRAGAALGKRAAGKEIPTKEIWAGAQKTAEATEGIITEGLARTSAAMSGMPSADVKRAMRQPFMEEGKAARRIHNLSETEFDKYAEDFTEILNKQDLEMRKVRNDIGEHIDPALAEETDLTSGMWQRGTFDLVDVDLKLMKIGNKIKDPEIRGKIDVIREDLNIAGTKNFGEVIDVALATHKKNLESAVYGKVDPENFIPLEQFNKIKTDLVPVLVKAATLYKHLTGKEIKDLIEPVIKTAIEATGVPYSGTIGDFAVYAVKKIDPEDIQAITEKILARQPKLNAKIIKRNQEAVIKAKKDIKKVMEKNIAVKSKAVADDVATAKQAKYQEFVKAKQAELKITETAIGPPGTAAEKDLVTGLNQLSDLLKQDVDEISAVMPYARFPSRLKERDIRYVTGVGISPAAPADEIIERYRRVFQERRPFFKDIEEIKTKIEDYIKKILPTSEPTEKLRIKQEIDTLRSQLGKKGDELKDEFFAGFRFKNFKDMLKEAKDGKYAELWDELKEIKLDVFQEAQVLGFGGRETKDYIERMWFMRMFERVARKDLSPKTLADLFKLSTQVRKVTKEDFGLKDFTAFDARRIKISENYDKLLDSLDKTYKQETSAEKRRVIQEAKARVTRSKQEIADKAAEFKAEKFEIPGSKAQIEEKVRNITRQFDETIDEFKRQAGVPKTEADKFRMRTFIQDIEVRKQKAIEEAEKTVGVDPSVKEATDILDTHLKNADFYGRNAKEYQVFYDHAIPYDESYRQLHGTLVEPGKLYTPPPKVLMGGPRGIVGTKEGVFKTDRGYFEKAGVKEYLENIHLDTEKNRATNKALGSWLKQSNNFLNKANELQIKGVRPTPDAKNLELLQKKIIGKEPVGIWQKGKRKLGVGKVEGPELDELRTRAALKAYKEKSPFLNELAWIGLMGYMGGPLGVALTTGARMLANPAFASRVLSSLENIHRITDGRIANSLKLFIKEAKTEKVKTTAKKVAFVRNPALQSLLSTQLHPGGYKTQEDESTAYKNRFEEISEWVMDPAKLEDHLTLNTQGMANFAPGITDEFNQAAMNSMNYLFQEAPKQLKMDNPLEYEFNASPSEIYKWARTLHAVDKPLDVLDDLAEGRNISKEAVEALQTVYPALYSKITTQLMDLIAEKGATLSYRKKLQASILLDTPVTQMMNNESLRLLQTPYEYPETPEAPKKGSKKMKLVSHQTNIDRIQHGQEK